MVQLLFGAINFVIPTQIPYYFALFFSYARIGDGIFPMSDVLLALFTVLSVWILIYIIKLILWGLRVVPLIGNLGNLPRHSMTTTTSETTTKNGIKTTESNSTTQRKRWM